MRPRAQILIVSALLVSSASWAQWSPVSSDAAENTAAGTQALYALGSSGKANTAVGYRAQFSNVSGSNNSALGSEAMLNLVSGSDNSAAGFSALAGGAIGTGHGTFARNTALGSGSLFGLLSGQSNTALGFQSMYGLTTGSYNTAMGNNALYSATTASLNTAIGAGTLYADTTGSYNTVAGSYSMQANTVGALNSALGFFTMGRNVSGSNNAACGSLSYYNSTTGARNTGLGYAVGYNGAAGNTNTGAGYEALYSASNASNNIALGANAGYAATGSNNIYIGHPGVAGDSGIIRLGVTNAPGPAVTGPYIGATYVAGITASKITGLALYIDATGKLGTLPSALRYKTGIRTLEPQNDRLERLRPVSFRLKSDPSGDLQYGLVAEEVARVYPELVTRDEAGLADGVRYDEISPLLLTEMKRLTAMHRRLRLELRRAQKVNSALQASLEGTR